MKILVVSNQSQHFSLYKRLFETITTEIDEWGLGDEQLKQHYYDLVICDFTSRKQIGLLDKVHTCKKPNTGKLILISPYPLEQLRISPLVAQSIDFIMGKPLDVDRLMAYIDAQLQLLHKQEVLRQKNEVLSDVIDLNIIKIGVFNLSGILYYANIKYLEANHRTTSAFDTFSFDELSQCKEEFKTILANLKAKGVFQMERQQKGQWFRSFFYLLKSHYVVHLCQEVTDEKHYVQRLERASVFFENAQEGMIITDSRNKIISINRAFSLITGYTRDEIIGKTPSILQSGIHEKEFYEYMWDSLQHNGRWQGEIWNKRKNGEIYPEWLSVTKLTEANAEDATYMAIFTDISSLKETDKKLHYYANFDQLTGLCNRVQFENLFNHALSSAKRRGKKLALMFIDLDHFKEVNDTHGHAIGDIMLRHIAKKIQKTLRQSDVIARIGGDEFNVLIEGLEHYEDALELANKINEAVKAPIEIEGNVFFMSLSIGIAIYPDHGEDAGTLSKHADTAMYEIKSRGRNGVMVYNTLFTDKVLKRSALMSDLNLAIAQDQFEMYYQPIVCLKTDTLLGAEALLRWHHPTRGTVAPGEFIAFAKENNLILELSALVFEKCLEDALRFGPHLHKNKPFTLAINVSSQEFFSEDYAQKVTAKLEDFAIAPSMIELEITETYLMRNPHVAVETIGYLRKSGLHIALDDFGTGYSSLNYLKNLPIDKLKIDQSFVRACLESHEDMAIVEAIVTMAKIFGMKVHAEGVETKEQAAVLKNLGCDVCQGYYYAKPLPFEAFIAYMKESL